jgi:anti-sigma factor RsiW
MPSVRCDGRCGNGDEARMTETGHTDIAAYVLGILDEPDNIAFEKHLQACPDCQLDLLELRDLPELLAKVKRRWPAPPIPSPVVHASDTGTSDTGSPPGKPLVALLDEAASSRRKQRWRSRVLVAAAAVLIVAGPLVTMSVMPGQSAGPAQAQAPALSPVVPTTPTGPDVHTGSAASQNGGVSAQSSIDHVTTINAMVSVTPKEWGTQADLELGGITGPLRCRLIAVSYGGEIQVMSSWSVPVKGYGVPGSPEPLRISGSTGLTPAEIQRFEVRTDDDLLVTVDHTT